MLFNPIFKTHWIFKEFFSQWSDGDKYYEDDNIRILKTTHLDNDFLTEEDHKRLENESDPYWHNVYTLGNWGILGSAILTNWRIDDLSDWSQFNNIRHGLDFGFSSDPAAYVKCHYDGRNKKIYILTGWAETDLTNPMIADKVRADLGKDVLFCDSAEPKSIKELNDNGIDARPVKKGPDSVLFSIQWLQQHEIIVDEKLQHIVNELSTWQWKKDKNGEALPIPVDKQNHSIDSIRYALEIENTGIGGLDLS
jgi:phage terminase large subunit